MGYRLYHHLSTSSSAASTTATVGASPVHRTLRSRILR